MSSLSNFSIETNEVVLLKFFGGREIRATRHELPDLLKPEDLAVVLEAYGRRHKFVNQTLPTWARAAIVVIMLLSLGAGAGRAFSLILRQIQHRTVPTPSSHPAHIGTKEVPSVSSAASEAAVSPARETPTQSSVSQTLGAAVNVPIAPTTVQLPIINTLLTPVEKIVQPVVPAL